MTEQTTIRPNERGIYPAGCFGFPATDPIDPALALANNDLLAAAKEVCIQATYQRLGRPYPVLWDDLEGRLDD